MENSRELRVGECKPSFPSDIEHDEERKETDKRHHALRMDRSFTGRVATCADKKHTPHALDHRARTGMLTLVKAACKDAFLSAVSSHRAAPPPIRGWCLDENLGSG